MVFSAEVPFASPETQGARPQKLWLAPCETQEQMKQSSMSRRMVKIVHELKEALIAKADGADNYEVEDSYSTSVSKVILRRTGRRPLEPVVGETKLGATTWKEEVLQQFGVIASDLATVQARLSK